MVIIIIYSCYIFCIYYLSGYIPVYNERATNWIIKKLSIITQLEVNGKQINRVGNRLILGKMALSSLRYDCAWLWFDLSFLKLKCHFRSTPQDVLH